MLEEERVEDSMEEDPSLNGERRSAEEVQRSPKYDE